MKNFILSVAISVEIITQLFTLQNAHAEMFYPVKVDDQLTKVRFSKISLEHKVENEKEQILLSGIVTRRIYNSHILPGHIDFLLLYMNDQVLKKGVIAVSGLNLRHNRYGRYFSIVLADALPDGSYVKIGWHKNQAATYHKQNSLL